MFCFVVDFEGEVLGVVFKDCGNYLFYDLFMVKWELVKYLYEVLEYMIKDNLYYFIKE